MQLRLHSELFAGAYSNGVFSVQRELMTLYSAGESDLLYAIISLIKRSSQHFIARASKYPIMHCKSYVRSLVFCDVRMGLRLSVFKRIRLQRSFGKRFRMVVLKVMGEAFYIPIFVKRAISFRGKRQALIVRAYHPLF
jgi:hypothetical protein